MKGSAAQRRGRGKRGVARHAAEDWACGGVEVWAEMGDVSGGPRADAVRDGVYLRNAGGEWMGGWRQLGAHAPDVVTGKWL